jgi:hypothetical protein
VDGRDKPGHDEGARARVGADGAAGVFRVETIRLKTDALRHAKARGAAALMQAGATVLS